MPNVDHAPQNYRSAARLERSKHEVATMPAGKRTQRATMSLSTRPATAAEARTLTVVPTARRASARGRQPAAGAVVLRRTAPRQPPARAETRVGVTVQCNSGRPGPPRQPVGRRRCSARCARLAVGPQPDPRHPGPSSPLEPEPAQVVSTPASPPRSSAARRCPRCAPTKCAAVLASANSREHAVRAPPNEKNGGLGAKRHEPPRHGSSTQRNGRHAGDAFAAARERRAARSSSWVVSLDRDARRFDSQRAGAPLGAMATSCGESRATRRSGSQPR